MFFVAMFVEAFKYSWKFSFESNIWFFAKSIQTDINHYVTRDRINNASFRQRLDPISKNILRRQNPLELVFEDVSTFDPENPIVGSLLREIDIKKKTIWQWFY